MSAATRFYEIVWQTTAGTTGPDSSPCIVLSSGLVLRIVPESTEAVAGTSRKYDRGRDIRLEIRVSDADEWLQAFVQAGATLVCRLAPSADDGVLRQAAPNQATSYAQVLDPFGHRWAIAWDRLAAKGRGRRIPAPGLNEEAHQPSPPSSSQPALAEARYANQAGRLRSARAGQ
jgi:hypothetical protein